MVADSALTIRGLHYSYGAHRVVDGIDLDAQPGSILGVLGPNGAGKSTMISLAVGTRRPDAGSVKIFGRDPVTDHEATSQLAGVMLQDGGLPMSAKPLAVLRHLASLYPNPLSVDELAQPLGLNDFSGRAMRRLSGGQKQRVALAAALIGRPRLVFLDEPCAGLDPQARAVVHSFVRDLASRGVAVVLTTHDLAEAEELSDQVVVIDRGRIIAQGAPEELRSASPDARRLEIRTAEPVDEDLLRSLNTVAATSAQGQCLTIDGELSSAQIAALCTAIAEAGVGISDIGMHAQSLADVFFDLTGRPLR